MRKLPRGLYTFLSTELNSVVVSTADYWKDGKAPVYTQIKIVPEKSLADSYVEAVNTFYKTYGDDATLDNITPKD